MNASTLISKPFAQCVTWADRVERVIGESVEAVLAGGFALYCKTKAFRWHMAALGCRDHDVALENQANELYAVADCIAERICRIGGSLLMRSISHVARIKHVLAELHEDNQSLVQLLRTTRALFDEPLHSEDVRTLDRWIDETARRARYLQQAGCDAD
jgi:starvation-inducible DNA-binding protein